MSCIRCQYLERAIEARQSEYNAALGSACYRVCKKSAAFMRVELEHARAELEEHQFVCPSAFTQPEPLMEAVQPRSVQQEEHWGDHSQTAA
jgi:hypothetical protein